MQMTIKSCFKEYDVDFYPDFAFMDDLCAREHAFFVVDRHVYELYADIAFAKIPPSEIMLIDAVETGKNLETAMEVCDRMSVIPAKRNARLISFGGGIIQDITGFAASILYRGISWTFVPTTLLAACDSCIGGKTSLNYKSGKNLLGTFYPPDEILICSKFFHTLSPRDYQSGLGEVVKFNILTGQSGIERIEKDMERLLARDEAAVDTYVSSSLEFKKGFIEEDEFDRAARIRLNYGHTFGHAIETVTDYGIPHGTAVAIGSVVANRISLARGILSESAARRTEELLVRIIHVDSGIDLNFDAEAMVAAIKNDKKRRGEGLTAILLDSGFDLRLVHDLTAEEVSAAVLSTVGILNRN